MYARFIDSIHALDATSWNQLCPRDYPFVRHEFLAALEDSKCTTTTSGWQVQHLLIYSHSDVMNAQLLAIMPGYIKTHSYGEYVFDWSWADAYRRYGYAYYPKWINAIPFTPCVGPRVLCHTDISQTQLLDFVVHTLQAKCNAENLSGWHSLFPDDNTSAELNSITRRLGCQFHWFNRDYRNFDDFVATMNSRKRKNILKERRQVLQQGFVFEVKTADQLTAQDWDTFYALYRNTYLKRSGHAGYLNAEFFQQLGATMSSNLVLICACLSQNNSAENQETNGEHKVIAASLFFRDQHTLYGRYWGCFDEYQFLHFETCYYQGIDYAIAEGLTRFDGGAQGEHKIARGFEPVITYSHHWLKAPEFRSAIDQFIAEEAEAIQHYADEVRDALPFKLRE